MDTAVWVVRIGLAAMFAVAGGAKLGDQAGARGTARGLGVPDPLVPVVAVAVAMAELVVAVMLLASPWARGGALAAAVLLGIFFVALAVQLIRGVEIPCACFGQVATTPAGLPTLARNLVLAAGALFVLGAA